MRTIKDDEKIFLIDVYKKCKLGSHYFVRDLINEPNFYIYYKRAWYLLEEWSGKRWYEWGVTLDLGWLEPSGIRKAEELIDERNNI